MLNEFFKNIVNFLTAVNIDGKTNINNSLTVSSTLEVQPNNPHTTLYVTDSLVGINTEFPNVSFTVNGKISSNEIIYDKDGNSTQWNSGFTSVKNTSANWDSVYTSVKNTSANWNSVYSSVLNTSANWDSVYTSVKNTSANWDSVYSSVKNTSANWDSVYTSVKDTSANWDSVFSSVLNTSANWDSVYSSVKDTSANWDSVYSSVLNTSANWDSVYSTYNKNSSDYTKYEYVNNNFLPLSGGTVTGITQFNNNVTIWGVLSATGGTYFSNTIYSTTSAISVVHIGSGPALFIGSIGTGDIASFYDLDQNLEMLHIGGRDGEYPHVGIKTSTPNVDFTVNGEISSNNIIYDKDGNSTQWNSGFTSVKNTSANWDSVFTSVKNTSANWDSVYSTVNKNSSDYTKYEYVNNKFLPLSGGTVTGEVYMLSSLQAGKGNLTLDVKENIVSVYGILSSNSIIYANNGNSNLWNSSYNTVLNTSGNWDSVYSSVRNTSGNWDSVYTSVRNTSANWNSVYSSVLNTSGNWDSVYSSVRNTSGNWDSVYSSVRNTSGNWDSVYTSVRNTSANWNSVYSSVLNTSGNWDSVYSSVRNTSGNWDNSIIISYTDNKFLPLSGGNITESLSVDKNVYVSGVISASASNVKINIINDSVSKTFTDDDNNKVVHLDTTLCPLCAIFPDSLSSGFNVAIMNTGINNLVLSATNLKSVGTIISTRYGGAFVYKEVSDIFAVGRLI